MSDIFSRTKEQSRVDSGSTSSTSEVRLDLQREFTLKHGVAICMGLMLGISMYVSPTAVIRGTHSGGLALGKSQHRVWAQGDSHWVSQNIGYGLRGTGTG